ncbi:hypothetical protein V6Z12_D03G198000 [Gossypium hirsutum]
MMILVLICFPKKLLTKIGAKSIEAGIGCGVGFGHGSGVGLSAKPGMVHQIQCCVIETMAKLMMKFGKAPGLPFIGGAFPVSFRSGWTTTNEPSRNPVGNMNQIVSKLADSTSQGLPGHGITSRGSTFGTRTEKVLSSFLQNPVFNEDETSQNELVCKATFMLVRVEYRVYTTRERAVVFCSDFGYQ